VIFAARRTWQFVVVRVCARVSVAVLGNCAFVSPQLRAVRRRSNVVLLSVNSARCTANCCGIITTALLYCRVVL